MSLRYLLDEDILGLVEAVARFNESSALQIDLIAVGQHGAPVRGTKDDALLIWAEEHDRILVTNDKGTMPDFFRSHLQAGHSSPGVFVLRRHTSMGAILDHLLLAAEAVSMEECANCITWIP